MVRWLGTVMAAAVWWGAASPAAARTITIGGNPVATATFQVPDARSQRPTQSYSPPATAAATSSPARPAATSSSSSPPSSYSAPNGGGRPSQPERDYNHEAAVSWINQGALYLAQGRFEDADDAYTKALGLEPGNAEAEQGRRQERDIRVAKADSTLQPIKQAQIARRLERLADPADLAHAEALPARGAAAVAAAGPDGNTLRRVGDTLARLRGVPPNPALDWARGVIAQAIAAAPPAAGNGGPDGSRGGASSAPPPEQLRQALAVAAMALAQPGASLAPVTGGGSAAAGPDGLTQARETISRMTAPPSPPSPAGEPAAGGTGDRTSKTLGRLKVMLGGTSGLCWDSACASTAATLPAIRADVPRIVAAYDRDPIIPPGLRTGPQGPAMAAAEQRRDQGRTDQGIAEAKLTALQNPATEPDRAEHDAAIDRATGQHVKGTVTVVEANHDLDTKIDVSFMGEGVPPVPEPH